MRNRLFHIVIYLFLSSTVLAQEPSDRIHLSGFNVPFLETVVKEQIDDYRATMYYAPLVNDSLLYRSAKRHAAYLLANGGIGLTEEDPQLESAELRAIAAGAKRYKVTEVVVQTYVNREVKRKGEKLSKNDTYESVAKDLVWLLQNSSKHSKALINDRWQIVGSAIAWNPNKKQVKLVVDFAWVEWKYDFEENREMFPYSNYQKPTVPQSFSEVDSVLIAKKFQYKLRSPKRPHKQCYQCKNISEQVISDSVPFQLKWKGNNIKINTKNLHLVYNLFDDRKDGLAVEIVEYLPYDQGNPKYYTVPSRRNGQSILNGYVQKPVYRRKLFKKWRQQERAFNRKKWQEAGAIITEFRDGGDWLRKPQDVREKLQEEWKPTVLNVKVGKHPRNPDAYYEINLLVIQKKKICKVLHFPNPCGETITQAKKIEYVTDFSEQPYNIDTTKMELKFTIPFEKGKYTYKYEDIKPLLDSVALENFVVKDAVIKAYSSVEGDEVMNQELQVKRAESIISAVESQQVDVIPAFIEAEEDWDLFKDQIKNNPTYESWAKKSKEEVKELLKMPRHAAALEAYLAKQRRAEVSFKIYYKYDEETYGRYLMKLFHMHIDSTFGYRTVRLDHRDNAAALQSKMKKAVEDGVIDNRWLVMLQVPAKRVFAKMLMNQLWIMEEYTPEKYKTRAWKDDLYQGFKKVGSLKRIDDDVLYNYLNFLIREWKGMKLIDRSMPPKKIWKKIQLLQENGYNGFKLYDLEMNYHFKAANYYFKKRGSRNLQYRNFSVQQIMQYFYGLPEDAETALKYAKFFAKFEKPRMAEELLRGYFNTLDPDPELVQFYLKVSYRHPDEFPNSTFVEDVLRARKLLSDKEWCEMFVGPCKLSFQSFDDERIRNLYCKDCSDTENFAHDPDSRLFYTTKVVK